MEFCRLNAELQKTKSHQGEQASQLQRLQEEVTRIQSLLDKAQNRIVSKGLSACPGQEELEESSGLGCRTEGSCSGQATLSAP